MNVALWIVQGLLTFAFIAAGAMKLFAYEKYKAMSQKQNVRPGAPEFLGIAARSVSENFILLC